MAPSPRLLAWRGRIEAGLRLAAPALDLLLVAGDRVARTVEPDDHDGDDVARPVGTVPPRRRVGTGA